VTGSCRAREHRDTRSYEESSEPHCHNRLTRPPRRAPRCRLRRLDGQSSPTAPTAAMKGSKCSSRPGGVIGVLGAPYLTSAWTDPMSACAGSTPRHWASAAIQYDERIVRTGLRGLRSAPCMPVGHEHHCLPALRRPCHKSEPPHDSAESVASRNVGYNTDRA